MLQLLHFIFTPVQTNHQGSNSFVFRNFNGWPWIKENSKVILMFFRLKVYSEYKTSSSSSSYYYYYYYFYDNVILFLILILICTFVASCIILSNLKRCFFYINICRWMACWTEFDLKYMWAFVWTKTVPNIQAKSFYKEKQKSIYVLYSKSKRMKSWKMMRSPVQSNGFLFSSFQFK